MRVLEIDMNGSSQVSGFYSSTIIRKTKTIDNSYATSMTKIIDILSQFK